MPFERFPQAADELFDFDDPVPATAGHALLAAAALASGERDEFREHERRWTELADRHGLAWLAAVETLGIAVVEITCGAAEQVERRLRESREVVTVLGDIWWAGTTDAYLGAALVQLDRPTEFLRFADYYDAAPLVLDRDTQIRRLLLRAQALRMRGSPADAEKAARRGLELAAPTDLVLTHSDALLTLADVLVERGQAEEANSARAEAVALLRAKGNHAAVARIVAGA